MGMIRPGSIAIVTGASKGIGRSIATRLAEHGARLVVNYRADSQAAEQTVGELRKISDAICVQADTTDPGQVRALVDQAVRHFGQVDILVNNAGITRPAKLIDMDFQTWKTVIGTALDSCFHCAQAVLPGMLGRGHGRIVNISSAYGLTGSYGQTNYCAAKAGVIGFTKALALETAKHGITVNAVAPGLIDTGMATEIPEKIAQRILAQTPMGRMGQPAEVATLVAYLVSEEAAYITGQVMSVNGGLYM